MHVSGPQVIKGKGETKLNNFVRSTHLAQSQPESPQTFVNFTVDSWALVGKSVGANTGIGQKKYREFRNKKWRRNKSERGKEIQWKEEKQSREKKIKMVMTAIEDKLKLYGRRKLKKKKRF